MRLAPAGAEGRRDRKGRAAPAAGASLMAMRYWRPMRWDDDHCPSGIDYVAELPDVSTDPDTELLWREKYPSGGEPKAKYYGVLEDAGSGDVVVALRDNLFGERWRASLAGGDNTYSYRRTKR